MYEEGIPYGNILLWWVKNFSDFATLYNSALVKEAVIS